MSEYLYYSSGLIMNKESTGALANNGYLYYFMLMRGECLAAPRLALLVSRPDQNARESPLCLQILTIMVMRQLQINHDPADFGQPRAHLIAMNTYRYE